MILLAGNVRDATVLVNPLVGRVRVATVARAGVTAVNHDLDGRNYIAAEALGSDLDAVGKARHGGVGPAGSAVLRNVLVEVCRDEGLAIDIPHHSSVMIRRSAYEVMGGYRIAFYFGQDWDLWYRLASAGLFVHLPQVLTRVRLFSEGLSSRHWREQRSIAKLSLACYVARCSGQAEDSLLEQAANIQPRPHAKHFLPWDGRRADGAYFIAEALRRNGDRRCKRYFKEALRFGFWKYKIWLRSLQSLISISES